MKSSFRRISIKVFAFLVALVSTLVLADFALAEEKSNAQPGGQESAGAKDRHTLIKIREFYWDRNPFAKFCKDRDLLKKTMEDDSEIVTEEQPEEEKKNYALNLKESRCKFSKPPEPGLWSGIVYQYVFRDCGGKWVYDKIQKEKLGNGPWVIKDILKLGGQDIEPGGYFHPHLLANDVPAAKRDEELFENRLTEFGVPMSDTQFQLIDRENNQRFLELLFDPERWMWLTSSVGLVQGGAAANSLARVGEDAFGRAVDRIMYGDGNGSGAVINVANDANKEAGRGGAQINEHKPVEIAVAMVQLMYHNCYIPMAILFLLPGALASQMKMQVNAGVLKGPGSEEATSPWEGCLRAIVAVFLLFSAQLVVSYSIDVGNALAESVKPWVNRQEIFSWAHEQTYEPRKYYNAIKPPVEKDQQQSQSTSMFGLSWLEWLFETMGLSYDAFSKNVFGEGGQGKAEPISERESVNEANLTLSQMMQLGFNSAEYTMSEFVINLNAFQLVMLCYLFLLGPLAGAFFAWPTINQTLFRPVYGKWVNAVITVSVWRFYWMVCLAALSLYVQDIGMQRVLTQFEMMIFACFLGLMCYVPFQPFSFDPGSLVDRVAQSGASLTKSVTQHTLQQAEAMGVPADVRNQFNRMVNDPQTGVAAVLERGGNNILGSRFMDESTTLRPHGTAPPGSTPGAGPIALGPTAGAPPGASPAPPGGRPVSTASARDAGTTPPPVSPASNTSFNFSPTFAGTAPGTTTVAANPAAPARILQGAVTALAAAVQGNPQLARSLYQALSSPALSPQMQSIVNQSGALTVLAAAAGISRTPGMSGPPPVAGGPPPGGPMPGAPPAGGPPPSGPPPGPGGIMFASASPPPAPPGGAAGSSTTLPLSNPLNLDQGPPMTRRERDENV